MPFKSKAQQKFMFAKKPELAKKWADKYGMPKNLPKRKKKKNLNKMIAEAKVSKNG